MEGRPSLEGARCAELPPEWVDKYFDVDAGQEKIKAQLAKEICKRCVAQPDCRRNAMTMSLAGMRGVIAGTTVSEIREARSWRNYELGIRETVPKGRRPEWLWMTDATNTVEQGRLEADPDEVAA